MVTETIQTQTIQEKPPTTERYVKLRKLTAKDGEPVEDILHRAADQLRGLREKATIQLRLIRVGESARCVHSIQLTSEGAFLQTESVTKPTLVVITTSESLRRIAEGSYSPVQAYLDGKMHLHGDVDLAKRVILHLGDVEGPTLPQVSVCPTLLEDRWQPDGNGFTGSLTFSGLGFTHGGAVHITYDLGGASYPSRNVTASENGGFFQVTAPQMPCGDIPGKKGIGVTVTATDHASGQSTHGDYSLPCR